MIFGKKIKTARIENKMTQKQLALELKELGFNFTNAAISSWESNVCSPDVDTILALCKIFNKDANYFFDWDNKFEELTKLYTSLSHYNQQETLNYMKYLLEKQPPTELICVRESVQEYQSNIQILGQTAAGKPLEYIESVAENIENLSEIPPNSDFALTVCGDSMEPLIKDGSLIFVHTQEDVENGTIAVIDIDGAVTCKKVYKEENCLKLVSLNPKYEPFYINKGQVRIVGKVVFK